MELDFWVIIRVIKERREIRPLSIEVAYNSNIRSPIALFLS